MDEVKHFSWVSHPYYLISTTLNLLPGWSSDIMHYAPLNWVIMKLSVTQIHPCPIIDAQQYHIPCYPYTGAQLQLWREAPAVTRATGVVTLNFSATGGVEGQFVFLSLCSVTFARIDDVWPNFTESQSSMQIGSNEQEPNRTMHFCCLWICENSLSLICPTLMEWITKKPQKGNWWRTNLNTDVDNVVAYCTVV